MASMANESNVASHSRPILPTPFSSYDQSFSYNQPDDYELKVGDLDRLKTKNSHLHVRINCVDIAAPSTFFFDTDLQPFVLDHNPTNNILLLI